MLKHGVYELLKEFLKKVGSIDLQVSDLSEMPGCISLPPPLQVYIEIVNFSLKINKQVQKNSPSFFVVKSCFPFGESHPSF